MGANLVGAVDGTRVLHGLLPALTEGGTDCVRAEEEGRALLARICKDKLSPDLRARLAAAGLDLRENPQGWALALGEEEEKTLKLKTCNPQLSRNGRHP